MIAAYLRERFRPAVFIPVATVIGVAAAVSTRVELRLAVEDIAVAALLLLQFRLWDDLADRKTDAISHPNRVLVRATSIRPFVVLCVALAVLTTTVAVVRHDTRFAVSTLLLLKAALSIWYALRAGRSLAGDQLLLAKYPAFVLVVGGDRAIAAPMTTAIAATAIYAAASIYEAWHDPASPAGTFIGGRS